MRILILGASGEIGHITCKVLSKNHDVIGLMRNNNNLDEIKFFDKILPKSRVHFLDDFSDIDLLENEIEKINPTILVNCLGVVKHREECREGSGITKYINSDLPHLLSTICINRNIRFIHLSTDCVFSGKKGNYKESDIPDPLDYYGKSKMLGEVNTLGSLTLRTSFIGPSLFYKTGLFEWIRSQKNNTIDGYKNAIYSGLTTFEFASILNEIIEKYPHLDGLLHVSSDPINKFDLLSMINDKFELNININSNDSFNCNRSLDSTNFRTKTNIYIPLWKTMINDLYNQINREKSELT